MVLRVLDVSGSVIHDCVALNCDTSWDGYDRRTGEPVAGRSDPDLSVWSVAGDTARER